MTLVEKMIATAFYRGYSLSFDYVKYDEDTEEGSLKRRRLSTVSGIKYNDDDDSNKKQYSSFEQCYNEINN